MTNCDALGRSWSASHRNFKIVSKNEVMAIYYGRKIERKGKFLWQPLSEHLKNTEGHCARFVGAFSDAEIGRQMGAFHDVGKYNPDFQRRLAKEDLLVSHAYAGALECEALFEASKGGNFLYRLVGMAISGHHSGLKDYGTATAGYCGQMQAYDRASYAAWRAEAAERSVLDVQSWKKRWRFPKVRAVIADSKRRRHLDKRLIGFSLQMFGRFLFSSLVDADRIDAQNFPDGAADRYMAQCAKLADLGACFDAHMAKLQESAKPTPLNAIRSGIQRDCLAAAEGERGFYSLSVPTGGGKTLSSMAFALAHAKKYDMERVIYAIPFTSIIEQNAQVFAEIFGRDNVLEHHSNFELPPLKADDDREERSQSEALERRKLAEENWHEPVVVTTNVQFFESLFSHKPGRARKVHHIANSVVILDEVQAIPVEFLQLCMAALQELVANYGCTVVFCTATQPEFDRNALFLTDVQIREIIADVPGLFGALRRTQETYLGAQTLAQVSERLLGERQALCIVNTKRHARDLARALAQAGAKDVYHLSTNLYSEHRKAVLAEIRKRLKDGLPCRVISTQLIEAGVDIDFPAVYRAAAGIDSVVQAAGRCNREGRRALGRVYVFVPEEKYRGKGYLERTAQIGGLTIEKYPHFLECDAVRAYFRDLFNLERGQTDAEGILELCEGIIGQNAKNPFDLRIPYAEIGKRFKLIADDTYALVIPTAQAQALLAQAAFAPHLGGILRELAQYTVNVRKYELQWLAEQGALNKVAESIAVLADKNLYDETYGLLLESTDHFDDYII